jgi:hypothetical protein
MKRKLRELLLSIITPSKDVDKKIFGLLVPILSVLIGVKMMMDMAPTEHSSKLFINSLPVFSGILVVATVVYRHYWRKGNIAGARRLRRTRQAGVRTIRQAEYALDLLSAFVPKRISNEEIGDAMEAIHHMVQNGRPKSFIYTKIATTFFWVFLHTALHYAERIAGIWKAATGKIDTKSKD